MAHIKINDEQLFFDVYGSKLNVGESVVEEKPTLIVLHGGHGFADHTLYVEFWSQFSDQAQVIFLDQRGCGRSDIRDKSEWNLQHWGEDLYQFCKILSIEKPVIAGVSMGGHVMCEYVNKYPDHPGALIFCNTEARFDLDKVCDVFRKLGGDEVANLARQNFMNPTPAIIEEFKQKCVPYYAKNAYTPEEIGRCVQRTQVFEHYCKNELHGLNYLNAMSKVNCPTLFMVGGISPGHPPAAAQEMASRIDKQWVTYSEFEKAGAPVYKDSPDDALLIVKDFLDSLGCDG